MDSKTPRVINTNRIAKQVGIIRDSDGAQGSIRVMAKGRVNVPVGHSINQNWLALNGAGVTVYPADPVAPAPATNVAAVAKAALEATAPTQTPASTVPTASTDKGE